MPIFSEARKRREEKKGASKEGCKVKDSEAMEERKRVKKDAK